MGNAQAREGCDVQFRESLEPLRAFGVDTAKALLDKYLDLDLDFGIPQEDLQRLFRECELDLGGDVVQAVFDSFPKAQTTKTLNALDFLEGFAVLCRGTATAKVDLMYDIFDFQKRGEISFDELTIMFMCAAQGTLHMSGVDDHGRFANSTDEDIVNMIRSDFGFQPGEERDIPKDHYLAWAKEKVPRDLGTVIQVLDFLHGHEPSAVSASKEQGTAAGSQEIEVEGKADVGSVEHEGKNDVSNEVNKDNKIVDAPEEPYTPIDDAVEDVATEAVEEAVHEAIEEVSHDAGGNIPESDAKVQADTNVTEEANVEAMADPEIKDSAEVKAEEDSAEVKAEEGSAEVKAEEDSAEAKTEEDSAEAKSTEAKVEDNSEKGIGSEEFISEPSGEFGTSEATAHDDDKGTPVTVEEQADGGAVSTEHEEEAPAEATTTEPSPEGSSEAAAVDTTEVAQAEIVEDKEPVTDGEVSNEVKASENNENVS